MYQSYNMMPNTLSSIDWANKGSSLFCDITTNFLRFGDLSAYSNFLNVCPNMQNVVYMVWVMVWARRF